MARPTITASTPEEFKKINDRLNDLPERILAQLENVYFSLNEYLVCNCREKFEFVPTILIPNNTTHITYYDDEVVVSAGNLTIKYPLKSNRGGNHSAEKVNFVLIDLNEDKK